MAPEKQPQAVSWIGGEAAGWIVFGLAMGALGCFLADRQAIAAALGVCAAIAVFVLLESHRARPPAGAGLFYCAKCQYYFKPERVAP